MASRFSIVLLKLRSLSYDKMATLRNVLIFWRILGLCPYSFRKNEIVRLSHVGLIYAIMLSSIYTVIYLRAVKDRLTLIILSRETTMSILTDFTGLSAEFGLIVLSWIYFGFQRKKVKIMLSCFNKIDETYENIGIRVDNERIFRDINLHTIIINLLYSFLCISDHLLLISSESFSLNVWLPFNMPRIVTHNIMIMYIETMRAVEQRFTLLNKGIRDLRNDILKTMVVRRKSHCRMTDKRSNELKSFVNPEPLEIYFQLHSELVHLAKVTVDFFAFSILFIMLTHLIQMLAGLYTACLVTKNRKNWQIKDAGSFVVLCAWFIVHFMEMTILTFVSDSTAKEANITGNIVHKMLLESHTEKFKESAKIMSLRLLQRQLKIELFGLFQMRPEIITTIMGMVATYITIMMQLDDQGNLG